MTANNGAGYADMFPETIRFLSLLLSLATPVARHNAPEVPRPPRIVTREEWGSNPDPIPASRKQAPAWITIHHAGVLWTNSRDPVDFVRAMQAWGKRRPELEAPPRNTYWPDLPYHYLIAPDGRIFEGRPVEYEPDSNTSYPLPGNIGVEMMGDFNRQRPSLAQLDSVVRLTAWLMWKHRIPAERVRTHRDAAPGETDCPGRDFYRYMLDGQFRKWVRDALKGQEPKIDPGPPLQAEPPGPTELITETQPPDNALTDQERRDGWQLLFDGKTLNGWMTSSRTPSRTPVEEAAINPHGCGGYMMVHEKEWGDFVLSLDFKISPGCNSGIFVRTSTLTPRPGRDVGFNGLEIAIDDTATAGYHDTGAIYDLVKPARQAMKPAGRWNHVVITCRGSIIEVELNGDKITRMDLDQWASPGRRPDGSSHKFDEAFKNHPRSGYIGLQDHGSPCWFKNIKLKPISANGSRNQGSLSRARSRQERANLRLRGRVAANL